MIQPLQNEKLSHPENNVVQSAYGCYEGMYWWTKERFEKGRYINPRRVFVVDGLIFESLYHYQAYKNDKFIDEARKYIQDRIEKKQQPNLQTPVKVSWWKKLLLILRSEK